MNLSIVDLRSDTVTRPTPEMYAAMRHAPLGDDVLGDEPTVTELERLAAERTGKEAAVFVPSGTMGNQIALAVHCRPGDAAIFEDEAHMLYYEVGAPGAIAGIVTRTVEAPSGVMEPERVEAKVLKASLHTPGTTLLCLENTHNRRGGAVIPLATMRAYREVADRHEMRIHLDGARVFNAAVALGVDVREVLDPVDSVCFCLSKGLGAPVGSVLCGTAEFLENARIWRKRLGGGMRQSGILAACGIVSLTTMVDRLADDHRRARALSEALSGLPGLCVDPEAVQTNIVMVDTVGPADPWVAGLREAGVWCMAMGPQRVRLVFHHQVDDDGLARTIAAFQTLAAG